MFSVRSKFALSLLLVSLLAGAALGSDQTSKTSHKHKTKPKPKLVEEPPSPPLPPPPSPTPEQLPSRQPTVTYQNGELTIQAANSTLGDILRAVGSKTGASIDVPPGANERVVSQFGPGPAREVLAKLLNGTNFNYVMIGTPADPTTVAQLILTVRRGGEENANHGAVYQEASQPAGFTPPGIIRRGFNAQLPPNQVQNGPGDDPGTDGTMEEDASADSGDTNDNEAGEPPTPEPGNTEADQQANPNQPQVKTPEQLLQELQRQQQTLQQQEQPSQQQQPQPPQPYQPQIVHPVQPYPQTQPPQAQPPQQ